MIPHCGLDLHAESVVFRQGDLHVLGSKRLFEHRWPVVQIWALAAFLYA
jgi:hypothetical protein